ncbi:hypothetical protein NGRA_1979 [Nosema granulosis]|uniref:Uncharacterized protein n=1 Tax=Nosema granulosis TaxID=83296 RepID=A0A9P6H0R5_9MICR|nr:hypothetical protein NGRA_1979 [Nosema granulosis]
MEDLSGFYKELRTIHKEKILMEKERILENLAKNKKHSCFVCEQVGEVLCEVCMKNLHRNGLDLEPSTISLLFKEYKKIENNKKFTLFEFLYQKIGAVSGDLEVSDEIPSRKTVMKEIQTSIARYNTILKQSFHLKDEKIMFRNLQIKIKREIMKNYFLLNLLDQTQIIEEHLKRIKKTKLDTKIIKNELMEKYKSIYKEI